MILFEKGKIIGDGNPQNIKAKLLKQSVSFTPISVISFEEIRNIAHVTDVYEKNGRIYVLTDNTDAVLASIFDRKLPVQHIEIERGRLEDAFEQLVEKREAI